MDILLKIVVEVLCAAVVLYILVRETFPGARKLEASIRSFGRGTRNG